MAEIEVHNVEKLLESDDPLERMLGAIMAVTDHAVEDGFVPERVPLIIIGHHEVKGTAVVPLGMENGSDVLASLASAYAALGDMQGFPLEALIGALRTAWGEKQTAMNRAGRRDHRPRGARGRGKRQSR